MLEFFLYESVLIFSNLAFQDGCCLSLILKIVQNIKMTISQLPLNGFCVKMIITLSCFKIKFKYTSLDGFHY